MKLFRLSLSVILAGALLSSTYAKAEIPKGFFLGIEAGPMSHFEKGARIQPYFGVNAGFDILNWFALAVTLNQGFAAYTEPAFSILSTQLAATFSFETFEWLEVTGTVAGGGAYLSPGLDYSQNEWGMDGRLAVGLRYYTLLAGLSIGADISYTGTYALKSERFLSALSLTPQLKYVF